MRRFLVPEVVQTSAMDCGPASLKALLDGFGVHASYGRLREACFTGVDGTSIDQVEEAAVALGLDAEQIMLPVDHLFLEEAALPALIVMRQASGATHFIVAWRCVGGWVQVMDPGVGRQWRRRSEFLSEVYLHTQAVPASNWREWAGSADFLKPLEIRLAELGVSIGDRRRMITEGTADASPNTLAALDAATRLVESLAKEGAADRGRGIATLIDNLACNPGAIPQEWWSARLTDEDQVRMRGMVLLRVKGVGRSQADQPARPELAAFAEVAEPRYSPLAQLWRALRPDGLRFPLALTAALALAAAGVVAEAVLFRGFFDLARALTIGSQRWWAIAAFGVFFGAVALLEMSVTGVIFETGRRFEARLRLAFLSKLPRLADGYFRSRLLSDMATRAHSAHRVRELPVQVAALARACFCLAFTIAGIAWLYPESTWPALAAAVVAIAAPLLAQPWLAERDLRARSHAGALSNFFLDSLMGLTALRAEGAGRAIARGQETLLGEWAGATLRAGRASVALQGVQALLCLAMVTWLLIARLGHSGNGGADAGGLLLLIYWALNIPALGQEIAALACEYPRLRNVLMRFTEPLGAREEDACADSCDRRGVAANACVGVAIEMQNVSVRTGGIAILEDVTLRIAPGEHVAVIGTSGAGKSSLAGLLLGWHRPSAGEMRVDHRALDGDALAQLRRSTVWISPQVQLWNRPLFDNLGYGNSTAETTSEALADAHLTSVVENLPQGLQTALGESGRLLSGGEGQRVRMGRGLQRPAVRLAILDEAFRGLERGRRRQLLETARRRWKDATLLTITHDVGDTLGFDRVLVVAHGRVVEDGSPRELFRTDGSRYRNMLDAEDAVRDRIWSGHPWRRMTLENGRLQEESQIAAAREVSA